MENNNNQIELKDVVIEMRDGFKKMDERFGHMDEKFEKTDKKLETIDEKFDKVDERFDETLSAMNKFADNVQEKFNKVDERFEKIETTMVTKDYLDEKLSDLRDDLVVMTRKEDKKLISLVEILEQKKVLPKTDADLMFSLEPFPQVRAV